MAIVDAEVLLPLAIRWAEEQAAAAERDGVALDAPQIALASRVGVRFPGRVRLLEVERMPAPSAGALAQACRDLGFLGPDTAGLTLGSSVFLKKGLGRGPGRVLAHELRHVAQYEDHGSIAAYLKRYLPELLEYGYDAAPFEVDARNAEQGQLEQANGFGAARARR